MEIKVVEAAWHADAVLGDTFREKFESLYSLMLTSVWHHLGNRLKRVVFTESFFPWFESLNYMGVAPREEYGDGVVRQGIWMGVDVLTVPEASDAVYVVTTQHVKRISVYLGELL